MPSNISLVTVMLVSNSIANMQRSKPAPLSPLFNQQTFYASHSL